MSLWEAGRTVKQFTGGSPAVLSNLAPAVRAVRDDPIAALGVD
jgi:hypothetical protein